MVADGTASGQGFDPHRPYQLSRSLHRTCESIEAAKGSNKPGNVGSRSKASRHGWQAGNFSKQPIE
jgi:hypothetical protein